MNDNPYLSARDKIRDTAKWMITIFAAVAGILTTGIQLSNLGKLPFGGGRFWIAIVAAAIAFIAIGGIIWLAANVLTVGLVTRSVLLDPKKNTNPINLTDKTFLGPYNSIEDLLVEYDRVDTSLNDAKRTGNSVELAKLQPQRELLDVLMKHLLWAANFSDVLRAFNIAKIAMPILAFFAALSVVSFMWASNPPAAEAKTVAEAPLSGIPVEGNVNLTEQGKVLLSESLGASCVQKSIRVFTLSKQDDNTFDVITIPSIECKLARFALNDSLGALLPAQAVDVPK